MLSYGRSPPKEQQPFDVVDEIGHADLDRGPRDADGADEQAHAVLLLGEHMLDTRADLRFCIVGPPYRLGHGAALRLFAMDVAHKTVPCQKRLVYRRSVGGIGPHPARRIGLVEQAFAQTAALVGSGVWRCPFADEAKAAIHRAMVLIAEQRN